MNHSLFKTIRNQFRNLIGPGAYEKLRYHYYLNFVPNGGYSRGYYLGGDQANSPYYEPFARAVIGQFHPKTVADIGCGSGGISMAFKSLGCEVHAFDGSKDSVALLKDKGLPSVRQFDFTKTSEIPVQVDLCLCLELAEHLPEKYAEHLCGLLAHVAPVLVFTAAPPSQGGHLHINLKEPSYWIELMGRKGLQYDADSVQAIRTNFGIKMLHDYDRNLMVFKRADFQVAN